MSNVKLTPEMGAREFLENLSRETGWSEFSMLVVACRFIDDSGLTESLARYAEETAKDESQ